MSTQGISGDARHTSEDHRQLMAVNNALLEAIIDIKQLLQSDRQISYPGTIQLDPKEVLSTANLNIEHFIGLLGGRIAWTSDPEEHLELESSSRTLKVLWPSIMEDG